MLEEGDMVNRMSGYGEAMLRKDLQMQDNKVIFDEDKISTSPTRSNNVPRDYQESKEYEPDFEQDNIEAEGERDDNLSDSPKPDQTEEEKIAEPDGEFEIIETDLFKQLEQYRREKRLEPKAIPELYVDDP